MIPPPIWIAHLKINELVAFLYHNDIVPKLGLLEWILVTPSNHRVHHARNPKYIDKNYGVVFIIWDRLFSTFQEEDENEPVAYGLVHPVNSFNPFWIQFHHFITIWKNFNYYDNWTDKLSVFLKG